MRARVHGRLGGCYTPVDRIAIVSTRLGSRGNDAAACGDWLCSSCEPVTSPHQPSQACRGTLHTEATAAAARSLPTHGHMQLVMETQIEVPGGSGADSSAEDACNGSVHGASPNAASASAASPMPTPLPTSQRATTEQQPAPAAVPPVPSVLVNNQPIAQTLSQDAASAAAGPSAVPPAGSHRSVPTSPTLGPAQATDSGACASAPDTPAVRQSTALNPGSASTDSHQPSAPPLPAHGGTVSPQPSAPLYYPWPTPENPIPSSPSLVDWASLPPPPLYTSNADFPSPYAQSQQQQQQPLPVSDIPSYRYTDISYTTHAPPGMYGSQGDCLLCS